MTVHGGQWRKRSGGSDETYGKYERCDHCGSITPQEALRRMTTPGCKFSGTDKGGYKFYFDSEDGDHGKFYGEHLADLSESELAVWAEASRRCLGVDWEYVPGKQPKCWMPKTTSFYGWQTWGKVGDDGQPVFAEGAPTPPDAAWWGHVKKTA